MTDAKVQKQAGVKYAQFSAVGISNMLADVGVLNFLPLLGPTRSPELLVLYNVAALVLGSANSYLWNTFWTFKDQARHDAKQVGLFTAQGLFNVALGSALLWLAAHGLIAYTPLPLAQQQRAQGHLHGVRLDGQLPCSCACSSSSQGGLTSDRWGRMTER